MLRGLATGRDRVARGLGGRRGAGGRARRRLLLALRVRAEGSGHRDARLDRLVEVAERELERAEERDDVLERHEPEVRDAYELPFHLTLAAGDDRVVIVAQDADEIARVDPGRGTERGDRGRGVPLVREDLQRNG